MSLADDPEITSLRDDISEWVAYALQGYPRKPIVREEKIIRDPVHGFCTLKPFEIDILDCPLLQRLRYVHQNGLTYLLYPGAQHTRFEHSLGVLYIADQMIKGLQTSYPDIVKKTHLVEIRLAAILHDVGHTFFSHVSESIIEDRFKEKFRSIKSATFKKKRRFFESANVHEILSYFIVTSGPFKKFANKVWSRYSDVKSEQPNIDRIAGYIIGNADPEEQYMADIIHGPLDADKLDYMLRDCYYTGIHSEVDTARLINTLRLIEYTDWPRYLSVRGASIPYIEQILMTKLVLYGAIYHHHKVRALECMVKGIFEKIWARNASIKNNVLRFKNISDFYILREFEFLCLGSNEKVIAPLVKALVNRDIIKRSLVICKPSVATTPTWPDASRKLSPYVTNPKRLKEDREKIVTKLRSENKTKIEEAYFWIDVPKSPEVDETAQHFFVSIAGEEPQPLANLFPCDDWLRSYATNKLTAHVFCPDNDELRKKVADVSEKFIFTEFGIKLDGKRARQLAHVGE